MGFSVTFSFANARDVAPVPCPGNDRSLRRKMIDLYRANNTTILTVLVTLRQQKRRGLFLDITLTDEMPKDKKLPFGKESVDPEKGTQETVMGFRLTRGMIYRPKTNIDALEEIIAEARLYPV